MTYDHWKTTDDSYEGEPQQSPTPEDERAEAWEYWHQRACELKAVIERLKTELSSRAIRTMGPSSPFWNCTICGAAHQTPACFKHKPDCLLADAPIPTALVPESRHKHFHSIEVQHAGLLAALQEMLKLFGRPHPEEYVDGGASYRLACDVVERARAAIAKATGSQP